MLTRKILLAAACVSAATTLSISTAHADRRTGLSGNLLIQDPDDLFPFPQYTLKHRNMLRLDYGGTASSGNGVMTFGDAKQAVSVALHRGDLLSPDVTGFNQELAWLSGAPNPFGARAPAATLFDDNTPGAGAGTVVAPATVADLSYARAMGENALGVRLGFGRGAHVVKVDGSDSDRAAQTFFAGQVGYSITPPQGLKLDVSGDVVAAFGRNTDGQGGDADKGFNFRAGGLVRGYYPINDVLDVGFLGNLAFSDLRAKNQPNSTTDNTFNLGAMAGVGPAIHLERAKVAAYGGVTTTFTKQSLESTNVPDSKAITLSAPMVNMAVEVQLLDWLFVRTGAQYTWNLDSQKNNIATDRQAAGQGYTGVFPAGTNTPFIWSAGLGLKKDEFYFDGVFQNAFVTGGPNFIGGTNSGFLAMASATYKFGDVLSASKTSPAPAPAPVPVASTAIVTPVYAPEPVQEVAAPAPVESANVGIAADSTASANNGASAADGANGAASATEGSAGGTVRVGTGF